MNVEDDDEYRYLPGDSNTFVKQDDPDIFNCRSTKCFLQYSRLL